MTQTIERPERTEAVDYYFTYIDQVPAGDIRAILDTQARDVAAELRAISDETSLRRYAPDKWTIREVVSHLNDAERAFTFRAFWFARGFDSPLPSFDQDVAVRGANADQRTWHEHIDEFDSIRAASLAGDFGIKPNSGHSALASNGPKFPHPMVAFPGGAYL